MTPLQQALCEAKVKLENQVLEELFPNEKFLDQWHMRERDAVVADRWYFIRQIIEQDFAATVH